MSASSYQRMTLAAKQAVQRGRAHEPPIVCPRCSCGVMPCDMAGHVERCAGQLPAPHPLASWLTTRDALQYLSPSQLERLVHVGLVRVDPRGHYHTSDVVLVTAWMRALERL